MKYIRCDREKTSQLIEQTEIFLTSLKPPPNRIDTIVASLMIAAMQLSICTDKDETFEEALEEAMQLFYENAQRFSEVIRGKLDGRPN